MHRGGPIRLAAVAVLSLIVLSAGHAEPVSKANTFRGVDWTSAGVGGIGTGSATITLTGITGTVQRAFLYWHGVNFNNTGAPYADDTVTVDGTSVTGVSLGPSSTNCWGPGASRAYRADITDLISGNASVEVKDMTQSPDEEANGASIIVVFDDGNGTNDRDVVIYEGNDSNVADFPGEDEGWAATLTNIAYPGGVVSAETHVADGQTFDDGGVTVITDDGTTVATNTFADNATLFDGNSVPDAGGDIRATNGSLWDIHRFDITSLFGPSGDYTLDLTSPLVGDCLGLVVLALDFEAGAIPALFDFPPTPTCGSTLTVDPGQPLNYQVQASSAGPDPLSLTSTPLPGWATQAPGLPTTGNPVSTNVTGVPGPGSAGEVSQVTYTAEVNGSTDVCTVNLEVTDGPAQAGRCDMNGNRKIDSQDVRLVKQAYHLFEQGFGDATGSEADFDGDGHVTVTDIIMCKGRIGQRL
jgi:hypothetical protein